MHDVVVFVAAVAAAALAEIDPLGVVVARLELDVGRSSEGDVFWRVTRATTGDGAVYLWAAAGSDREVRPMNHRWTRYLARALRALDGWRPPTGQLQAADKAEASPAAAPPGQCPGSGLPVDLVAGRVSDDRAVCPQCRTSQALTHDPSGWGGAVLADHDDPTPVLGTEDVAEPDETPQPEPLPPAAPTVELVHHWPGDRWLPTSCCGVRPRQLPSTHDYSPNPKVVTCPGPRP